MGDSKQNAYGTSNQDTSFRRTWDKAEWAAKAKEQDEKARVEGKLRAEARAAGKKYYREPTPPDAGLVDARRERINFEENLNKTTLVPAGAGVGKKGRSAGFYCEACDLTFKDSLQWVDHLNSKQHLHAIGKTAEVEEATLEMVRGRLEMLRRRKKAEMDGTVLDLKKRLEERRKQAEAERIQKREKRKEARRRKKGLVKREPGVVEENGGAEDQLGEEDAEAAAMARMMGFAGGFGTTKKN